MSTFNLDWDEEALTRAVYLACDDAISSGADAILKDAKSLVPVGTVNNHKSGWEKRRPGSLRDSGRVVKFQRNGVIGAYIKFGGRGHMSGDVDTYYAPFVELGTPGDTMKDGGSRTPIVAKPYLRPALKKNKAKIMRKFRGQLR